MMANSPFGSGASALLDDLNGPDNGMHQLNSGFSSLSFPSTMPSGVIQKPAIAPISSNLDGSFRQEEYPHYPSSPISPAFRQTKQPQLARHHSLGGEIQGMAPITSFSASPATHTAPVLNTPVSLDGRSSQFLAGNNQQDHLASFLPPPPNLDVSDSSQQIGRSDNTGIFLLGRDNQPQSSFVSPSKGHGNVSNDAGFNRERSLSSPGTYIGQLSSGAKPPLPASSSHILYEDKPSSWNEGSGFPAPALAPAIYREGIASSPSNYDRFNSRPPRHSGTKDNQSLLSSSAEMRHAASDGNFNFQQMMPVASNMSPNHNQAVGSPSYDSHLPGNQMSDIHSFGNMDTLNSNTNFQQYKMSQSSPMQPGGLVNPANVQQANYFVHQSPGPPSLHMHNSAGTQHFLVNERGEIVGHASPVITRNTLEGFSRNEPMSNFPPTRPQRANSYGGQPPGHFNQIQPQFNQIQPQQAPLHFDPITFQPIQFQNDGANNSSHTDSNVGSIGDSRMQHHRNNTEPIPLALWRQNSVGKIQSRHTVGSESFGQDLTGENIEGIAVVSEITGGSSGVGVVEEKTPNLSYASKLMMPSPQPVADQTKGRGSSQSMTAGSSISKSGPRMIYNVKFKRSQRNFVVGQRVTREIKMGCYVKVEADRGEDLGIVMGIIPIEKFLSTQRSRSMTEESTASGEMSPPSHAVNIGDMKRIMRPATHDEITLLEVKRDEEEELLKICYTKVCQRGLPMSVVDAEYQFDRNKLTFFLSGRRED